MSKKPVSLKDKVIRLRGIFIEQLPERMVEARGFFDALCADPKDSEAAKSLHRYLHSIKGTGASFGFKELSVLSGVGEEQAKLIMEQQAQLTDASWQPLGACLASMEQFFQQSILNAEQPEQQSTFELAPDVQAGEKKDDERLIYICDDEALTAEQLGAQLNCFGYRTELFTNTADLYQAVLKQHPDAVVMDIMFPEGDSEGTNVLRDLRENQGIFFPAVFISARRDFDARLGAVHAGGEAYFPKPVLPLELVTSLDLLTRQSEPEPFRILIVDDEAEIAQFHSLILENAGMTTKILYEPTGVLDVVAEFRPDLVLMDMYMPQCSGQELAKVIRQVPDYVSLPIVFLSSETDRKKQFTAMCVGAEGFLTKPIDPDYLVTSVALRAERMRELRSLMARDSLTGLFNHTAITQFLENAITAARRQNDPLSFAMIDVDKFKLVNDTYGHPAGDQVLLALARVLQQRLRNSDLVGRYGGEEFAIILNDASLDKAQQIMDQLREDFSKVEFNVGEVKFSCTFSCGIAAISQFKNMETLREAADKAMYQAKHAGRNQVVIYACVYQQPIAT